MKKLGSHEKQYLWPIGLYAATSVALVGMGQPILGWVLFALTGVMAVLQPNPLRRQILVLLIPLAVMGVIPARANAANSLLLMALYYAAALTPAIILRKFKDRSIKFKFHHGRRWHWYEILYVFVPLLIGYLVLPVYFASTHTNANWNVHFETGALIWLFIQLMLVGVWDELFFIATVLGVFRRWLPFWAANALQSVVFASFLYALGFGGWGFITAYIFAWLQGYVFKITGSLLYAMTVHLAFDVVLFFALINATYPGQVPYFITG
jgi:membrane protease YdiL (CAAX protease family)